jgi:hypothetical protein
MRKRNGKSNRSYKKSRYNMARKTSRESYYKTREKTRRQKKKAVEHSARRAREQQHLNTLRNYLFTKILPRCKDERSRIRRAYFSAGMPRRKLGSSGGNRFTKKRCI